MDKSNEPGPSTPQETENANRQPGAKDAPGQRGPTAPQQGETGVGGPPPANNSAPGTRSRPDKPGGGPAGSRAGD